VLGELASKEKNSNSAFYFFNKSLKIAQAMGLIREMTLIHSMIGKTYYYLKQDDESALHAFQQSIIAGSRNFTDPRLNSNPSVSNIIEPYGLIEVFTLKAYLFYRLYLKDTTRMEHLKTAFECQELSVQIYERMLWGIQEQNSGLKIADNKVTELNNAVSYAVLLYLKTKDASYAEKALQYSEKSKMQLLLIHSMKKENLLKSGIPDSIVHQELRLQNQIFELENTLTLAEKSGVSEDNPNNKLALLYDQRDALIRQLEQHYPEYFKAKYNYNVAGLSDIQNHLKENEIMLEYQLLNTELITFVISKHGFYIHYQEIDKEMPACIEKLYHAISNYPTADTYLDSYNDFVTTSAYLYKKLIAPVYSHIKGKHLIIIPHSKLNLVPFEVLLSSFPQKKQIDFRSLPYLIKEFPVIYAYSANLLLEKNEPEKHGRGTAIFLPDYTRPGTDKQFYILKGAEAEAKAIRSLSNGHIYSGIDAREESFKQNSKGYSVLHIASHALMDDTIPMLSSMVMSHTEDTTEDGYLYAYEISQLSLNAQLVVLNGCNTGFGVLRQSEGLISIARSFFYAGVKTITYSLWPVADNSGSALMIGFYKELKKNKQLDDALRDTKLSFIENTDPVKAHPYYWANLMIAGKSDSVNLYKYPIWQKAILFLLIAAVLFGIYYRFRPTS
jgi:CHAT domain-containing protein